MNSSAVHPSDRRIATWCYALCGAAFLACITATAGANSPQLRLVDPPGYQRGEEVELTLRGRRLDDPQEVIFYEPGITVTNIEAENHEKRDDRRVKVTVKIDEDTRLGEYNLRVRTKRGWTDLRTFFVGDMPVTNEEEPNNQFGEPQGLAFNSTVHGVVTNEDVDHYRIEAKKGQRISVEVEGIRLGGEMFDPHVSILDADRFELSSSDDTALLAQDPFVSVLAPEDGEYVIAIRESAYGGNDRCRYRMHVGDFPRPTMIYPLGGRAGEYLDATFLGDETGPSETRIKLPDEPRDWYGVIAEQEGRFAPSPNWVRVSEFPNVLETEPNNNYKQATPAEQPLPLAFNGILEEEGDHDYFQFTAKEGQTLDIQMYGRALRSPLDAVVNLYRINDEKLEHIKGNDDSSGEPDSYIRQKMPADSEYVIRVRDHLNRGGEDYAYRVEVTPAEPRLGLHIPRVARNDTQSRQFASVPVGNRWAIILQADRANFGGDLEFLAENLPEGVTMHAPVMSQTNRVPIVFEAAEGASLAGELADLTGRHVERKDITGRFEQVVELVTGNPNRTPYYTTSVDRMAVAVTEEAPFKLRIVEPKVPLLQRGSTNLKVVAEREEGFDAPITLQFPFRPPGVGTRNQLQIPEGQSEVEYPLNANANARAGDWEVIVIGSANVDGGPLYVSSPLTKLTVAPSLVTGEIQMTVTEQGEPVEVVCKLNQENSFDGKAKVELLGLPNKVTTEPVEITMDDEEIVFAVTTDASSPVGQHKSLFCRLTLEKDGEPIVQKFANGGVLRIDKPRPKETAEEPEKEEKKSEPEKQEEKPEKRLSRLEQLRLELAEQEQSGGD